MGDMSSSQEVGTLLKTQEEDLKKGFGATETARPEAQDLEENPAANDDVQAGVKNIEAVSKTWTKWGLIAAYSGFVLLYCKL